MIQEGISEILDKASDHVWESKNLVLARANGLFAALTIDIGSTIYYKEYGFGIILMNYQAMHAYQDKKIWLIWLQAVRVWPLN
jgi:hypothetical protein